MCGGPVDGCFQLHTFALLENAALAGRSLQCLWVAKVRDLFKIGILSESLGPQPVAFVDDKIILKGLRRQLPEQIRYSRLLLQSRSFSNTTPQYIDSGSGSADLLVICSFSSTVG